MLKVAPLALLAVALPAFAQQKPPQPGQLPSSDNTGPLSLPNTIYAPPLTVGGKFNYRIVQSFGLRGFGGSLIGAAIGQASGTPYAWGGGMEGFGKRYASGLLGNLTRQSFAFALESALHEDPRYFPSEAQTKKARIVNAMKQVIICKTDAGQTSFAYGRVFSAFGSAQVVNTWQPPSNGTVGDGLLRGVYGLSADFASNLLQEFVPFLRPRSLRHHP